MQRTTNRYRYLTVRIPAIPGEAKRSDTGYRSIELNAEQEAWLAKYFPTTPNCILMEKSGLSYSTLHRHARRLHLAKMQEARTELLQWTYIHKTRDKCIKEGVYKRFRNNPKPEHLIQWRKKASEQGWNPIVSLRQNDPKRYASIMKKRSKARKDLHRKEGLRQKYGLERRTDLHIPDAPFTRKQTAFRYTMKQAGYILGDMREEMGERFVIYYDGNTDRSAIRERHATEKGFQVKPLID